jgi:glutaminyl-tRNA synthetase
LVQTIRKVVITNLPEDTAEKYVGPNHPGIPEMGEREVTLTREIYIERKDFMEDPPRKYFRLALDREVRLRYACYITARKVIKDDDGNIIEVHAEMDPESRGGSTPDGRKVKGTIHWASATKSVEFECRLYDNLFLKEDPNEVNESRHFSAGSATTGPEGPTPDSAPTFLDNLNPDSLKVVTGFGEPALADAKAGDKVQFERTGYFCVDPDSTPDALVINRSVGLRDSFKN